MIKCAIISTKKSQIIKHLLVLIILISGGLYLAGCGESYYFEETQTIENGNWFYQDSVHFEVDIIDSTQLYALLLDFNHALEYKTQNLYIYINTELPDGKRLGKQLSLDLAAPTGVWHGDCNKRNCDVSINLQQKAYFNQPGKYKFTLKQYMRADPIKGINSISLKIKELKTE